MKRKFIQNIFLTLLFVLILAVNAFGAIPEPMANFYVNDFADVISDDEQDKIIQLNKEIGSSGAEIVVTTVDFTDGMGIDNYATQMLNEWGIGEAGKDNGVLILFAIAEDDYFISLGTGVEKFISSGDIGVMIDWHLEAYFAAGEYGTGAVDIAYALGDKIKEHYGISDAPPISNNTDSSSSESFFVRDNAGVISAGKVDEITEINKKLFEETGSGQLVVYTVDSLNGKSISAEAARVFNEIGIGDSALDNGALIFFAIEEDDYYITLGSGLDAKMTKSELNEIMDNSTEPGFAAKNYSVSAADTVYALSNIISRYYPASQGYTNNQGFTSAPVTTNFNTPQNISGMLGNFIVGHFFNLLVWIFIIWLILRIIRPSGSYMGGGYYPRRRWFYPWTWFRPRWHRPYYPPQRHYPPPRNNYPPPRNNSGGGFFGGGSTSGGGGGRSSGGGGLFGSSGGGRTSGGGAGRSSWGSSSGGSRSSSSSSRSSSGSSHSSSSRSSSGGGRSSGGGAGRRK